MKYKQALKYSFFEFLSIKEDYLIANGGKANPYTLMKYIEVQLILMNPIVPHFAQYCWNKYVYPVLSKSKNYGPVTENLSKQPWPKPTAPFNKVTADRYAFLKKVKSAIRVGQDKAKTGGKKKPKKGAEAEPTLDLDSCAVFVAKVYPEFKKNVLTVLQGFEFEQTNKIIDKKTKKTEQVWSIVGDYKTAISQAFPDKKQDALQFVSFQLGIAENEGKEAALKLESSFDEQECIKTNQAFLFENMPSIKVVKVLINTSKDQVPGAEVSKENAAPANPSIYFYNKDMKVEPTAAP